jgi:hypothetical protein
MQTIETYLQLAGAQVIFYGPGGFRPALEDLVFPNGINVSPDGKSLYVASTTGREIRVYDRDPASEALQFRQAIPVGSGADNIEIDEHGDLWLGAHPKLLRIEAHGADPKVLSPSQVLQEVTPDGAVEILDDEARSTSTVAPSAATVFVSNVFDDGFLDCSCRRRGADVAQRLAVRDERMATSARLNSGWRSGDAARSPALPLVVSYPARLWAADSLPAETDPLPGVPRARPVVRRPAARGRFPSPKARRDRSLVFSDSTSTIGRQRRCERSDVLE